MVNVIVQESKKFSTNCVKFVKLSATSASINDVRKIVTDAESQGKRGKPTVVIFMDEIHRFNKLQQDIFLPHVEAGTFVLIGATTENPSSSLNSALLSRCRVFVLNKLRKDDLTEILAKAVVSLSGKILKQDDVVDVQKNENFIKFYVKIEIINWLAEKCDGDARVALSGLEIAVKTKSSTCSANDSIVPVILNLSDVKNGIIETESLADGNVNHMYCALHHSILGSDDNAALYWLIRILDTKEDPICLAKQLVRIASENTDDELALGNFLFLFNLLF